MGMKTPHIIASTKIVAFFGGETLTVKAGTIAYDRAIQALDSNDEQAFKDAFLLTEKEALHREASDRGFSIVNGTVEIDGVQVIGPLETKLNRLIREGHNVDHLLEFVRNLRKNPSRSAVIELYDFLSYAELPITEDGCFLAYKGLDCNYWSITAGKTKLIKGAVNASGKVFNGIGQEIECERVEVDDDRRRACSNGLHVGSFNYATGFGSGKKVLCKVNPKDVVSVPLDCSCQKLRACAYKVIKDCTEELDFAVASCDGEAVSSPKNELIEMIDEKVSSLSKSGPVTIKRIQSSLSPDCEPLHKIRDILVSDLGHSVVVDKLHPTSVGHMKIVLS